MLIKKIRRYSLLPPMTSEMLERYVSDWFEVLHGHVPVEHLNDTFLEAWRTRDPNRFFEPGDIYRQWQKQQAAKPTEAVYSKACTLCQAHEQDDTVPPCIFHQGKEQQ